MNYACILIEHNGDVNCRNEHGETPLHTCNNINIARLLIENGADPGILDYDGQTAYETCTDEETRQYLYPLCSRYMNDSSDPHICASVSDPCDKTHASSGLLAYLRDHKHDHHLFAEE